jgi:hypothetical protein
MAKIRRFIGLTFLNFKNSIKSIIVIYTIDTGLNPYPRFQYKFNVCFFNNFNNISLFKDNHSF